MDNLSFDYTKLQNRVFALKTKFPEISVITVGKSRMGRDIFGLTAGKQDRANLIIGGFEANDCLTSKIIMTFAQRYFEALFKNRELSEINIKKAALERTPIFIPCPNPDGAEIFAKGYFLGEDWLKKSKAFLQGEEKNFRANAGGVELERNFDFDFDRRKQKERILGIHTKSPFGFSGRKPFCEPETAGLRDFILSNSLNLICRFSLGNGEILWRGENCHKNTKRVARVLSALSGYALEAELGNPSEGIFRRWVSSAVKRPCIDIKIPSPTSLNPAEKIYAELEETLTVASVI